MTSTDRLIDRLRRILALADDRNNALDVAIASRLGLEADELEAEPTHG